MSKTNARSVNLLKSNGYKAFDVEKFIRYGNFRRDFGGFADILAYKSDEPGVLAVQCTTQTNASSHKKKILEPPVLQNLYEWLDASNRFVFHFWAKRGPRGKRKVWNCVPVPVTLEDLEKHGKLPTVKIDAVPISLNGHARRIEDEDASVVEDDGV